jgi:hypothetical protein
MLTSMYTEPDAVIISGGYSIGLDTNYVENSFLRSRFDYMLDTFNKVKVKTRISNTKTKFLFTWGENDPVPTMDPEHDFHYTETYFSGLTNCSYFYDFYDHTFPPCANIDTFIHRVLAVPLAHFVITDSSIVDTLHTKVQFCNSGSYDFDLYKDTTLINHYTSVSDSVSIALSDSGRYYIKNIIDSNNVAGKCGDTVRCNKYPTPLSAFALSTDPPFLIHYNNPFREHLNLMISADIPDNFEITIYNNYGMPVHQHQLASGEPFFISSLHWATGLYYLKIHSANSSQNVNLKLLKF